MSRDLRVLHQAGFCLFGIWHTVAVDTGHWLFSEMLCRKAVIHALLAISLLQMVGLGFKRISIWGRHWPNDFVRAASVSSSSSSLSSSSVETMNRIATKVADDGKTLIVTSVNCGYVGMSYLFIIFRRDIMACC